MGFKTAQNNSLGYLMYRGGFFSNYYYEYPNYTYQLALNLEQQWCHIIVVFTGNAIDLYLDLQSHGFIQNLTTSAGNVASVFVILMLSVATALSIGNYNASATSTNVTSYIDFARYYDYALSQSQVDYLLSMFV